MEEFKNVLTLYEIYGIMNIIISKKWYCFKGGLDNIYNSNLIIVKLLESSMINDYKMRRRSG